MKPNMVAPESTSTENAGAGSDKVAEDVLEQNAPQVSGMAPVQAHPGYGQPQPGKN